MTATADREARGLMTCITTPVRRTREKKEAILDTMCLEPSISRSRTKPLGLGPQSECSAYTEIPLRHAGRGNDDGAWHRQ